MNAKFIKVVLFIVFVAQNVAYKCSDHYEQFSKCSYKCQLTCTNYNRFDAICNSSCVPGCVCRRGFVRSQSRSCVRTWNCPTLDRASESYSYRLLERGYEWRRKHTP